MQRSTNRILTTHTGSLPRPPDMLEAMRAQEAGPPQAFDQSAFDQRVAEAVADNVRRQAEARIDVVNDGEVGKPSFAAYVNQRLSGFEPRPRQGAVRRGPIDPNGRDARQFPDYYEYVLAHSPFENVIRMAPRVCVGPLRYVGQALVQRDIANLKSAMASHNFVEGFLPSTSPVPSNNNSANEFYASHEEFAAAYADAVREEYRAILDAGLVLQIDDPSMISGWDSRLDLTVEEYRRYAERRVELLNYALRDLPQDRIRYHTCYGVNFGPRVSDLQLEQIIDIFFKINAGAYSFEAANPRHEHEWRVFDSVKLPEGKVLIPGMVTHSNVMIEHPQAVADRIERWASTVGAENLLVGNDCGFASTAGNAEIPPTVAWAKLQALGEGARLASQRLYTKAA
ncbi:MAG: cobalamin-independent methionine synthase II family protein [Chloroflexi bacterium]|nr:cobalamin-independent methionine synthase II family protein [Chloroflexota bacterium]